MRLSPKSFGLLQIVAFATLSVHTSLAASADNGGRLAQRWCAACHLVTPDQGASTEAPPFSAIARRPGFDAGKVALFLLDPHPRMPDIGLTRSSAEDLAAYIASQK